MTSKKPVILLTPYFNTERDEPYMRPAFLKAVRHAGAVPVILPLDLEEEDLALLLKTADGVLFTGGPDVHPFSLEKKPSITAETSVSVGIRWSFLS